MSLAISEKQQRRPTGCAGILYQLWEWNRRLAKKKIFSRKLLPPVRPGKRATKKFVEEDKMPMAKHILIADENRGGFRSPKKPQAHEPGDGMRAPGLVARLMGLESMPVVGHEKPRKAMDSGPLENNGIPSSDIPRLDQDLCRESSELGKLDSKPPKLKKAGGFLETLPGGGLQQGVQGKNALTVHSRNKHHDLASPVKSPSLLSGSNRARLMHAAATKILEPGLQSRSRAQRVITYSDSSRVAAKVIDEDIGCSRKLKISKKFLHDSAIESSMGYSLFEESRPIEEVPTDVGMGSVTFRSNGGTSFKNESMHDGVMPLEMQNGENKNTVMASRVKVDTKKNGFDFVGKKHQMRKEMHLTKPKPEGMTMSIRDELRQNQSSEVKYKVASGSKVYKRKPSRKDLHESDGLRGISPAGRIFNDHTPMRPESEVLDNHRSETSRITLGKSVRTRTITNTLIEHVGTNKITFAKVENSASHLIHQNINKKCTKRVSKREGDDSSDKKDGGIVSFTFNSPIRGSTRSCLYEEIAENKIDDALQYNPSLRRRLPMDAKSNCLQSPHSLSGGEISKFLEGRNREQTSLDQDEFGTRDAQSTAEILQELLTAFTTGAPLSVKNIDKDAVQLGPPKTDVMCAHGTELCHSPVSQCQIFNVEKDCQREAKTCDSAALMCVSNDQHSPISILEASFSNDSCSVKSSEANSEGKLQSNLERCNTTSCDMDADLVDSATSVDVTDLYIERSYSSEGSQTKPVMQLCKVGPPSAKLHEVKQAVSNVELLLLNRVSNGSDEKIQCPLDYFPQDLIKIVLDGLLEKDDIDYRETESSKVDLLKECMLDCIIQSLNSKYECFCMGYEACPKLPPLLTEEWLRREVHKEVKEWVGLTGKFLDNLIELDVRNSSRKWMIYEKEALDVSKEIEGEILGGLIDEMVMDLF